MHTCNKFKYHLLDDTCTCSFNLTACALHDGRGLTSNLGMFWCCLMLVHAWYYVHTHVPLTYTHITHAHTHTHTLQIGLTFTISGDVENVGQRIIFENRNTTIVTQINASTGTQSCTTLTAYVQVKFTTLYTIQQEIFKGFNFCRWVIFTILWFQFSQMHTLTPIMHYTIELISWA